MTDLSVQQFLTFPDVQDAWVSYLKHLRVRLRKGWRKVDGAERRTIEWTDLALANALQINLTELRNFDRTLKRLCRSFDHDFIIVCESINKDIKRALIRYGYTRAPDGSLAWNTFATGRCESRSSTRSAPRRSVRAPAAHMRGGAGGQCLAAKRQRPLRPGDGRPHRAPAGVALGGLRPHLVEADD